MKVLKTHDFGRVAGGRVHDWDTLLDGQIRQLSPEDMGGSNQKTFRQQIYKNGLQRYKTVRVAKDGEDGLIIQAIPMTDDQIEAYEARVAAKLEAKAAGAEEAPEEQEEEAPAPAPKKGGKKGK